MMAKLYDYISQGLMLVQRLWGLQAPLSGQAYTYKVGVLLFLRLPVVPWLILSRITLPHIFECSAHQGLAQQYAKVHQKKGIDGPEDVKEI